MERKNTLLLTVIAVATLLVAVVGATFAYFTASGTNSAESEIDVITRSIDAVNTSATPITMEVTLADMLETAGKNDYSAFKEETATLSLDAENGNGGGANVCTYDLVYTPNVSGQFTNTVANTTPYNELTIQGAATVTNTTASTNTVNSFTELSLHNITAATTLVDDAVFTLNGADVLSTLTWSIDVRFYNLAIDQSELAEDTFGGVITFENLSCVNNG